jgi:polyhydroxyalkanoate synthesis regulator phasin
LEVIPLLEPIKKTLLSLLGAAALMPDEIRRTIDELVTEGELTEEQGKRLIQLLVPPRKEGAETGERLGREIEKLAGLIPLVGRGEFNRLQERVRRLEERLGQAGQAPDEVESRTPERDAGA